VSRKNFNPTQTYYEKPEGKGKAGTMKEGGSAPSYWIRCRQRASRGIREGNQPDEDPEMDEGEVFPYDFHCNVWETLHI